MSSKPYVVRTQLNHLSKTTATGLNNYGYFFNKSLIYFPYLDVNFTIRTSTRESIENIASTDHVFKIYKIRD